MQIRVVSRNCVGRDYIEGTSVKDQGRIRYERCESFTAQTAVEMSETREGSTIPGGSLSCKRKDSIVKR